MEKHLRQQTEYVFNSDVEVSRLHAQAEAWAEEVDALFDAIGVEPGWRCLDLGCGVGNVLLPLSRRVGAAGSVVGVDQERMLLSAARDFAKAHLLNNVDIREDDAYRTKLPRASFDLVHERFVATPVGRGDELL